MCVCGLCATVMCRLHSVIHPTPMVGSISMHVTAQASRPTRLYVCCHLGCVLSRCECVGGGPRLHSHTHTTTTTTHTHSCERPRESGSRTRKSSTRLLQPMRHGVSVSISFCSPLKQTFLDGRCCVESFVLVNSLTCGRVPLTTHSHSHTDTHASRTALFQLECLKQTSKAVSKATGAKKKVRECRSTCAFKHTNCRVS